MELKILYFGMIAEATNCKEEIISLEKGSKVDQLENLLKNKYQKLQGLSFKIAIDKEIKSNNTLLSSTSEIALLPPFSGG
ncbi:MoaD/ThiS family protein [Aquimarina sp. MMG015]|uniref:MoaD/ThiS family protein n=1 Tax=unclassified Aquimarina TaxID=2627091 RepID=UPI000E496835|nr:MULTISPECIES: MoaD/ThiS family protein [unclassified Aquimarina]AXT55893.1 MoaD/ThiS family protein [Aquimarina sp. AD1]MBQ4805334.1 MoaD/ThiS family protein [Aquimarina sp. MMG015]RKN16703.1 MoaD/ThiS family protein [Aquimarina sp. AD1]